MKMWMWKTGVLGAHTPPSLVDTMVYKCELYFVLCNLQLRQLQLVETPRGMPYIENMSKNRPGGLKYRKIKSKKVKHHANYQRTERCFVRFFNSLHAVSLNIGLHATTSLHGKPNNRLVK